MLLLKVFLLLLCSILLHFTTPARILYRDELVASTNSIGDNVPAEKSLLNFPTGFAMWNSGEKKNKPFVMAIADNNNRKIRIIDNDGIISSLDNPAIVNPTRLLLDKNNKIIYFTELGTSTIKKYIVETKQVETVASLSSLSGPLDIVMNRKGDIFFTDFNRHVVRVINATSGIIDDFAGVDGVSGFVNNQTRLGSLFNRPAGLSFSLDESELFVADSGNNAIRKVLQNGSVITVAGNGTVGDFNSSSKDLTNQAMFKAPMCVFVNYKNELVVCDTGNGKIRLISNNNAISTIAGGGLNSLYLNNPYFATFTENNELLIADSLNNAIMKVSLSTNGNYSKLVGGPSGSTTFYGDGVKAIYANLFSPIDVSFNQKTREIVFSDNQSIRKITPDGNIHLLSSPISKKLASEGAKLSEISFEKGINSPYRVTVYGDFFYFQTQHYIYKVHKNETLEMVAGDSFYSTPSFALYPNGDFLISDTNNGIIRKYVWSEQRYFTIAGNYVTGYNGDGLLATDTSLKSPQGIALSKNNEVVFADSSNFRIRKILTNGTIITIAGNGNNDDSGEGVPALSSIKAPSAVGILSNGDVIFVEGGRLRHLVSDTLVTIQSGVSITVGLYIHSNDTIYIANCQSNTIQKTTIGDSTITLPIPGLSCPTKAIIIQDALFYTEKNYGGFVKKFQNNTVTVIAGTTDMFGKKAVPGVLSTEVKTHYPMDIAQLPDGNLLLMEDEAISFHNLTDGTRRTIIGYGEDVPARHTKIDYFLEFLKVSSEDRLIHSYWVYSTVDTIYQGKARTLIGTHYMAKADILPQVQPLNETLLIYCYGAAFANGTNQVYYDEGNNLVRTLRSDNFVETIFKAETKMKDFSVMPNGDIIIYITNTESNIWRYPKNGERYSIASGSISKLTADFETNKVYYVNDDSIRSLTPYCESGYDFNKDITECIPICNGIKANSSGVCSGRGYCNLPDSCVCTVDSWSGSNCNVTSCYGIMSNNKTVCSGNGLCENLNNCTCFEGYYGTKCQLFDCYGKNVCSNNGTCNGPGNCLCTDGYGGLRCDYPYCYGVTSDKYFVCNGRGSCNGINDCKCQSGWFGGNCNVTSCYGIDSINGTVCSNLRGNCVEKDVCQCKEEFTGSKCQYNKCFGKSEIDPSVCSGHGNCISPQNCNCKDGYIGKECEHYLLNLNYHSLTLEPPVESVISKDDSYNSFTGRCESLFDSETLSKLGEPPICIWNSNFTIYLGYNFKLDTGDILKMKNSNSSHYAKLDEAKNYSKNNASPSIKVNKLYTTIPSSSDLILRPIIDSEYKFSKSIDYQWSCTNCGSMSEFIGSNREMMVIPKSYLSSTSSISLVLNANNWMNNSKSSSKLDLKIGLTGPSIEFFNEILDNRVISCFGFECILEIETFAPSQSISLYGNLFTNVLKNKHMIRVFSDNNLEETESSLLCSSKDPTTSRDATINLQYRPFTTNDLKLSLLGVDTKYSQTDSIIIELASENESSFRLSKLVFNWNLERVENGTKVTTIAQSSYIVNSNVVKISAGSLISGIYRIGVSTSDDILGIGSVLGKFEITNSNTVTVKITKSFNSLSYSGCYVEAEIIGNITSYSWSVREGRLRSGNKTLQSVVLSQSENYIRNSIWISGESLFQEEDYIIEIQALKGDDIVGYNSYSFTSGILPRVSCDFNELSNNYLTVSCDYKTENPLIVIMEFYVDMKRKFVISNSLKKKLVTKYSSVLPNSSIKVKVVNREGNVGEVIRNLTVTTTQITDPLNYFKEEYSNIKGNRTSGLEMLQELNFLLTFLEYQSSLSFDNLKTTLNEILSTLYDIRSIGYNVDDKLISLIIPPLHKTYKLLYLSNKKIDKIDELNEWVSWSIDTITNYLPYYNEKTLPYILDLVHLSELNELIEIGQSQDLILFEKLKISLQVIEVLLRGPNSISGNIVETTDGETTLRTQFIYSSQELNSKQAQISDVIIKFPSNFASQLDLSSKRSCFIYKSSTNKKTDSNIVSKLISLSIQKIDTLGLVLVSNLNQTVDIIFDNIQTKSSNLSCNYYDTKSNTWSTVGIQTKIKSKSTNMYEITCSTNHFTTFSVIDNNIIISPSVSVIASPKSSQGSNKKVEEVANSVNIGLVVGILLSLFVVAVVIIIIIVIIALLVVFNKKKKRQESEQKQEETELIEDIATPSQSDFPSQESGHFTPLMSFTSIKSSDSQNSFNPLSRYKDMVKIGNGAFGSVFKCLDIKQNKTKALKVIKYSSAEELNTMMKEGSQLMNIDHENIIKVNDFFVDNSQILCIDMDFYSNGDLLQVILDNEWCSERKVKQIIYQICDALNFVHTKLKVIHRDVKPSNIFIRDLDSENIHVVLADFGLAKSGMGSVDKSYAGTPLYMSLELATGGKYSFNTDIYSLGVAIYQIMTKDTTTAISHMFIANSEEEAIEKLKKEMGKSGTYSEELINICLLMLDKDANKRPSAKTILSNPFLQDSIIISPNE